MVTYIIKDSGRGLRAGGKSRGRGDWRMFADGGLGHYNWPQPGDGVSVCVNAGGNAVGRRKGAGAGFRPYP